LPTEFLHGRAHVLSVLLEGGPGLHPLGEGLGSRAGGGPRQAQHLDEVLYEHVHEARLSRSLLRLTLTLLGLLALWTGASLRLGEGLRHSLGGKSPYHCF